MIIWNILVYWERWKLTPNDDLYRVAKVAFWFRYTSRNLNRIYLLHWQGGRVRFFNRSCELVLNLNNEVRTYSMTAKILLSVKIWSLWDNYNSNTFIKLSTFTGALQVCFTYRSPHDVLMCTSQDSWHLIPTGIYCHLKLKVLFIQKKTTTK